MFGRRQLLLGGATLLAGTAVTACTKSGASNATSPRMETSPTTASPSAEVPAQSSSPAQTEPTATQPIPPTTVTVAEPTTAVASTATQQVVTGPATYVAHGPLDGSSIALTFHLGGDATLAGELLDLLKNRGVTSTLFAIGDWLAANPALGHRAVDDGHELGNHTKSHKSMLTLSRADVRAEIVGGGEALVPFIGSIGKWFRPSGTDVPSDLILEEAGLAGYPVSVGYDIDSRDFQEPGAAAVVARVKKQLHAGAIVSLHFGHRDTIDALPQILDLLAADGLSNTTVTGLLG
ncbi:MAG: hypothetical protein QOJ66_796 [Ilumatobacteraceae bacterium]